MKVGKGSVKIIVPNMYTFKRDEKFMYPCTPDKDIPFYPGLESLILPMLSYPLQAIMCALFIVFIGTCDT